MGHNRRNRATCGLPVGVAFQTPHYGHTLLGLYACCGIVSAHGGTIAVESAGHDRGTTVDVTLPALDDEPGEGEV